MCDINNLKNALFSNESITLIQPKKRKLDTDKDIIIYLIKAKNKGFHTLPIDIRYSYVFCLNLLSLVSGNFLKYIDENLLK